MSKDITTRLELKAEGGALRAAIKALNSIRATVNHTDPAASRKELNLALEAIAATARVAIDDIKAEILKEPAG